MSKSNNKITEDGGPAFPVPSHVFDHVERGELLGMSLRLWLAGQALSNPKIVNAYEDTPDESAMICLERADAIIERSQLAAVATIEPPRVQMTSGHTHAHQLTIVLDEADYRDVMRELKFREATRRQVPDGYSCPTGTHIAEICRDLAEYRGQAAKVFLG